ncbi:MAG: hypothetical protein QM776_08070 [Rhodocyclaceae bacterium]
MFRYVFIVLASLWAAIHLPAATAATAATGDSPSQRVALRDVEQLHSEYGRQFLKYLIGCSLGADVLMEADVDGVHYAFPGSLGLAPEWQKRSLTPEEERWVSACIYSRTNYFGTRVEISITSPFPHESPNLQSLQEESAAYPVEDGVFFGNLFAPQPVAYVCGRNDSAERKAQLAAHKRICALPLDKPLADGRQVTACRFIYVGECSSDKFTQGGVTYKEAIRISLPQTPVTAKP